jgi:hypothetical protein
MTFPTRDAQHEAIDVAVPMKAGTVIRSGQIRSTWTDRARGAPEPRSPWQPCHF